MDYSKAPAHDGFFVEYDQCHGHIDSRTAAKMMARHRQDVIAGELSRQAADEYLDDMLKHMYTMEDETLADASLIDTQVEIQWYMRPYLIDFLVEAHAAFALLPETLHLTVNLLDRYCAKRVVFKHHYQLVGCAALLIASKYGDKKDRVPQITELSNMCCGLYDSSMFVQMETHVLNTLGWTIGHPTVDFFTQLLVAYEPDDEVECMASFLSEIALYHRDFVSIKSSTMSRASLALARVVLGRSESVDRELHQEEFVAAESLSQFIEQPSPTLSRKYSSPSTFRVTDKLSEFVAARAIAFAQAQRLAAVPPSPPAESAKSEGVYNTPHKPHVGTNAFDGYLTPPITPDGACFDSDMLHETYPLPPRCPVTPSPHQHAQAYTHNSHHVGLPTRQHSLVPQP
ncbi:hypothetical protein CDD82_3102 [Ophiocordyceps australis]|uniref:Cyclin-like domain-containing protein n=1 Tax=Ophiocordyceps australis TaxID=1399860 RepID=A0A2C5ZFX9_9HYPO|nr:hypothetical protein CDD82_3102 [Ophiocordyceps australis]